MKKGIYQVQKGGLVKVAGSIAQLKRRLRSPQSSAPGTFRINLQNGDVFLMFTQNNQEGIKLVVSEQVHMGRGYAHASGKKKLDKVAWIRGKIHG